MNRQINFTNYEMKNIKSDAIRKYCVCERLDEAYVRTSIRKRSLLTRLWNAVIKELTSPENGYETTSSIQRCTSPRPWNVAKE
ncbi:MAG TPA: hypothetical protein DDZ89_11740 [Clostridiales bacterium]|nr:hypothetical protein [Clostridiales bacterium]